MVSLIGREPPILRGCFTSVASGTSSTARDLTRTRRKRRYESGGLHLARYVCLYVVLVTSGDGETRTINLSLGEIVLRDIRSLGCI